MTSPQQALATALAGTIVDADRITIPGGLIYVGFTGKVRLQRPGQIVRDLGVWSDGTDRLVDAYYAWTQVAA